MNQQVLDILKVVWPLIVLEYALMIWALVDLLKRKKTKTLSIVWWLLIIIFINLFGPVAYFIFGRSEE
jgi:hypothetical protein